MLDFEATQIVTVFKKMQELERVLSELYRACAEAWPDDRAFWEIVADDELVHAGQLDKLGAIIEKYPLQFTLNRVFRRESIQLYIDRVHEYVRQVKAGVVRPDKFNYLARDIENSLLESRYNEILQTTNQQYQKMMIEFMQELEIHRQLFYQRIKEWEAK